MAFFTYVKILAAMFLFTSFFWGCSGKSDINATPVQKPAKHFSMGKPVAPIKLISAPVAYIDADKETPVDIELEVAGVAGILEIDFVPVDGLMLVDTNAHQSRNLFDSSHIKFPIKLRATNGRHHLNMHIRVHNDETSLARVLTLIVQAGAETDTRMQLKKISGENIITLPAQEEISTQ
ncbi:MAG: hypothetical protein ABW044_12770 [Cellvibrio sp.]